MDYDFKAHRDKEPFENIKNGTKTMELRLFDEKRQKIKLGDIGKLVNRENSEEFLFIKVIGLSRFENFENCYKVLDGKIKLYEKELLAKVYPAQRVDELGVLVIHFDLIE